MPKFSLTKFYLLVLIFAVLLPVSCDNNTEIKDEVILAQIDDLYVSKAHFETAFKEYYYKTGQVLGQDYRTKEAILNSTFGNYVLARHAMDLGLDQTDRALFKMGAIERRVLTEEYVEQIIIGDIQVTDAMTRNYFLRYNSQLRASHLYADTKEKIDQLYERLQSGESFDKLASEVFDSEYLKKNGGDIGHFSTDELDIAFENAAYELEVGQISKPVRTAQGYSIIKLTERNSKPVILESEYATAKENMRNYAYGKQKELVQREFMYDFIDNLDINQVAESSLLDLISGNYQGMLNKSGEFQNQLGSLNTTLASTEDFEFSTDQFLEEYLVSGEAMLNSISDQNSLKEFIKGVAYRGYLVEMAKDNGIDDQELVQASIRETWLNYLAVEADNHIKNSINNSPAELFRYYEDNRDVLYQSAQVNLQRIVVRSEEEAYDVINKLNDGASFSELVTDFTIDGEDLFTNGELGFESIKSYGFRAPKLSNLKVGEVSEIIQYQPNEYHIYKVLGWKDAKPMSFTEAEEQIDRLLTQDKLKELRTKTIRQVKEKHNAVVDLEKLKEITIQI